MRIFKILLSALLLAGGLLMGCTIPTQNTKEAPVLPVVSSTVPLHSATGVALNSSLTGTFSKSMDSRSFSVTSFTLSPAVVGVVSHTGAVVTFNPDSDLAPNTLYTATLSNEARDLDGNNLGAAKVWSFTTGVALDLTAPLVASTVPVASATSVALNASLTATFSEAMDPATLNAANFTVSLGTALVEGAVSYTGTVATFDPTADLAPNTLYVATISTGAKDLAGNALGVLKTWSFTTGAAADVTAPTVSATVPIHSATGVSINASLTATFSEAMDPATMTNAVFTLTQASTPLAGSVTYVGVIATFDPTADLSATTEYVATISVGAKDLAGNAMAAVRTWSFTTGVAPDASAPTVVSTTPLNTADNVPVNVNLLANFSEAMDPATMTAAFTLKDGAMAIVSGVVSYTGSIATFNPAADLLTNTTYTAKISTSALDLAGNSLGSDVTWTFTTPASLPLGPPMVDLGSAGSFSALAKTAINVTPTTIITGDIGLSPAAQSFITGLSLVDATGYATAGQVTGKVYAADQTPPTPANMTATISAMEAAYTDAAGRSASAIINTPVGNLGGSVNLVPGLYQYTTDLGVSTSFSLSGGANDVWIFQTTGNLTVASAAVITLNGGALAKNVFWQVAGTTSIGTTAQFKGTVLGYLGITIEAGSVVDGRLFSQTAVVINQATLTKPAP